MGLILAALYSVFALVWLGWGVSFWQSTYRSVLVGDQSFADAAIVLLALCTPLLIGLLFVIFVYVSYMQLRQKEEMRVLMTASKRTTDHLEVLSRHVVELTQQAHATEFLQKLNIIFSALSEVLMDIMREGKLTSETIFAKIWDKTGETKLLILSQLMLDLVQHTSYFEEEFSRRLKKNQTLQGNIEKFQNSFETLLTRLQEYDKTRLLVGFLEEGPIGRVYHVFRHLHINAFGKTKSARVVIDATNDELSLFQKSDDRG